MVETFTEHAAIICSTFPLRGVTTDVSQILFSSFKFSFNIWKLLYLQLYIQMYYISHVHFFNFRAIKKLKHSHNCSVLHEEN